MDNINISKHKRKILVGVISFILMFSFFTFIDFQDSDPIKIGIMDSGYPHPGYIPFPEYDFDEHLGEAVSFISEKNGYDYTNEEPYDLLGHGNAVISTILGDVNAPVEFYSAKILNAQGFGTIDGFIEAEQWMVEKDVDFVVLSVGTFPRIEVREMGLFDTLRENNILAIVSSGNYGNGYTANSVSMPAYFGYENIISVGASYGGDFSTYYSSVGLNDVGISVVDVVDVPYALNFKGQYSGIEGTSFSAPRVGAKVADFLHSLGDSRHDLLPSDVKAIVSASAGTQYSPDIGFGIPDVDRMMELVDEKIFLLKLYDGYLYDEYYYRSSDEVFNRSYGFVSYGFESGNQLSIDIYYPSNLISEDKTKLFFDPYYFTIQLGLGLGSVTDDFNYTLHVSVVSKSGSFDVGVYSQRVQVTNDPLSYDVYVDYSGLNDLRFNKFGFMTRQMNLFKNNGYSIYEGSRVIKHNLSNYDYVLSPGFEDRWYKGYDSLSTNVYDIPFDFFYHDNSSIEALLEYAKEGGTLIMGTNKFDYFQERRNRIRLQSFYNNFNISIYRPPTEYSNGQVISSGLPSYFGDQSDFFYHHNMGMGIEIDGNNVVPMMQLNGSNYDIITAVEIDYYDGTVLFFGDTNPFVYDNDPHFLIYFLHFYRENK